MHLVFLLQAFSLVIFHSKISFKLFNHMGQSLSQMYIHLIFGTKNRYPFIHSEIEDSLHRYIAGILKNLDSTAIQINSVPDPIHLLFCLSKKHTLIKVVEVVKRQSSKWMKEQGIDGFTWQIGYGAFSVSSSKIGTVSRYVINQKQHHKTNSFENEIKDFMYEYDIAEYDSNYFWS